MLRETEINAAVNMSLVQPAYPVAVSILLHSLAHPRVLSGGDSSFFFFFFFLAQLNNTTNVFQRNSARTSCTLVNQTSSSHKTELAAISKAVQ